jgi:hypothetical protein
VSAVTLSVVEYDRARRDPVVFADLLVGRPLWDHQVEVVRSPARYKLICAGRRAGKSHLYAVLALHQAFAVPRSKVLIVSSGEAAAKRLFREVAAMAAAPLLGSSVADESTSILVLENGSVIECVPASMRQVRSAEADLLIVDEAGFVGQDIWEAAEPVILARPGARVLMASTPWGTAEHFFRLLWRRGMDAPDERLQAWHWPSSISPLVDQVLLADIAERSTPDYFAREYLAEWQDESGAYFTVAELERATAPYELLDPEACRAASPWVDGPGAQQALPAVAGVDWGYARDANALALLSPLGDGRLFVPWLEAQPLWPYSQFIDRVVEVARAYRLYVIASERNGVGQYPTDDLQQRAFDARTGTWVSPVWTDARRKQSGFGKLKGLLQRDQLVLPNEPELLKQLRGLQFEQLDSGTLRIAVPDRLGHDDLAMALMQAVSCVNVPGLRLRDARPPVWDGELVVTGGGVPVPARPLPDRESGMAWCVMPEGRERGEGW